MTAPLPHVTPRLPSSAQDLPADEPGRGSDWDDSPPDSFTRLLGEARSGGSEASGKLLERFIQYLNLVAEKETDPRLRAKQGLSDVVQETLLDAHLALPAFRGSTPREFAAWLRRILCNNWADCARRYRRAEKRRVAREVVLPDPRFLEGAAVASDDTPSRQIIEHERDAVLTRAVASLPEHYRRAIELRHRHELSFAEIGRRMNLSPEAARKLWCRAVRTLGQRMKTGIDDRAD